MISANDILAVTKSVTKKWEKQRKAEERGTRSRYSRQYIYSDRVNFTEVADEILPDGYAHASGDGKYTVAKRQFYYAVREEFRKRTGREITAQYFSNTLLVQFMNRNPGVTADWKVTADPRGTLTIPNASHEVNIPCGTIAIDDHLREARRGIDPLIVLERLPIQWPSLAEGKRYQGALYIEKEGFEPILEEAKIAERYDLAIIGGKGQSVVAVRRFIDNVCRVNGGVPLFVAHDLDKAGFEIKWRLTTVSDWAREQDRVTYEFVNAIDVHDIGLRLADVEQYELAEEQCTFNGDDFWNCDGFCTPEEEEFLRSGRRVELNAFTSPQLIEWLETKLSEHLPNRLIPDDETLANAYRRAMVVCQLNAAIEEAMEAAQDRAKETKVPKTLRRMLKREMLGSESWDETLYRLVKSKLYPDDVE